MAQASWPSPTYNSRAVSDAEYERIHPLTTDGIFGSSADPAVVYADGSGMTVKIRANKYGLVRGHAWASGPTEFSLTIANNPGSQTRFDIPVLRLDRATWNVTAAIRQGSPGGGLPALIRNDGTTGLWEIPLGEVTVAGNATTILSGHVKRREYWHGSPVRECTQTTRPLWAGPGEIWYETDTGRWIGWSSQAGQWVVLGPLSFTVPDTGWLNLPINTADWTANGSNYVRKYGPVCVFNVEVIAANTIIESEIDANALLVGTVPAAVRPGSTVWFAVALSSDRYARVHIDNTGALKLQQINETLAEGNALRATGTYMI